MHLLCIANEKVGLRLVLKCLTSYSETMRKILFAGGGIGGLVGAILAEKTGIDCRILEQAPAYTDKGSGLSIMGNAILALRHFGMDEALFELGQPLLDFQVRDMCDRLIFRSDFNKVSKEVGAPSICLHRSDLQKHLARIAKNIPIEYSSKLIDFTETPNGVASKVQTGNVVVDYDSQILIGSDGLRSRVREVLDEKYSQLAKKLTPLRSSGFTSWLATIPFSEKVFKQGTVIHYWGEGVRVGLVDIGKSRLYWWITMNHSLVDSSFKNEKPNLEALKRMQIGRAHV